jgi:hypothetical protein
VKSKGSLMFIKIFKIGLSFVTIRQCYSFPGQDKPSSTSRRATGTHYTRTLMFSPIRLGLRVVLPTQLRDRRGLRASWFYKAYSRFLSNILPRVVGSPSKKIRTNLNGHI